MNFYKTISYTTIYTGINFLITLITVKVTSYYLGPTGSADLGMYNNMMMVFYLIASVTLQTTIIRGVSLAKDKPDELKKYIDTAFGIYTRLAVIISALLIIFYRFLSIKIFGVGYFGSLILFSGLSFGIVYLHSIINPILTGLGRVPLMTKLNIFHSIGYFILTVILSIKWGVYGTLLAAMIAQVLLAFTYIYVLRHDSWFNIRLFFAPIDKEKFAEFKVLGAVSLFSILTFFNQMIIRDFIQDTLSKEDAGLWSAMNRLSDHYLSFIIAILGVYYLPTLTALKDNKPMLIRELRKSFKRILPLVFIMSFNIWLFRNIIIKVFLTEKFQPMSVLFAAQLSGDVLKIAGYLFSFLMSVFLMRNASIILILISESTLLLLNYLLVPMYGLVGSSYAFLGAMFVYLLFNVIIFREHIVAVKKSVWAKPLFKS